MSDYLRNVTLSNIPEYFLKESKLEDGDAKSGWISFHTSKLDAIYGYIAEFQVSWMETDPIRYHVGKQSVNLMNEYINIGVGFSKKELIEINGHDAYFILGARKQVKRNKIYVTNFVLANFCCPVTKRAFNLKVNVFQENYGKMQEHIKAMFTGVLCH
ncbi:MAG: hypothetical protein ACTSUE_13820 [Promethearchaeota archaeon]